MKLIIFASVLFHPTATESTESIVYSIPWRVWWRWWWLKS